MLVAASVSATEDAPPGFKRLPDGTYQAVYNVDVIFTNINYGSDFRFIRSGTDKSVQDAILQVAKHISRGLYKVVSLNASEHMLAVIISTELSRDELMSKNGFPWDGEDDPQPDVVLK
ncbi:hypothetical protein GGI43DRAFT_277593 [Trichoderma evansii]